MTDLMKRLHIQVFFRSYRRTAFKGLCATKLIRVCPQAPLLNAPHPRVWRGKGRWDTGTYRLHSARLGGRGSPSPPGGAGSTVHSVSRAALARGPYENGRHGAILQLQGRFRARSLYPCWRFGLKTLLAKVITAQVRGSLSQPVRPRPLNLLLPLEIPHRVFGESEQAHVVFVGLSAPIRHTAVRHFSLTPNPSQLLIRSESERKAYTQPPRGSDDVIFQIPGNILCEPKRIEMQFQFKRSYAVCISWWCTHFKFKVIGQHKFKKKKKIFRLSFNITMIYDVS